MGAGRDRGYVPPVVGTDAQESEPGRPSSRAWTELLHAEVAHLLREQDIPVLHIKGPTVARWLYEADERPWGDVDVLVPRSLVREALAVLAERGLHERYPGVNPDTSEDHAVTLAHTDPRLGADEVDVHERFPGIDADPDEAFAQLWRRREPAELAHTRVWFPDLSTRALLVALNTARTPGSPRARTDLDRALGAGSGVDWEDVVALASRVRALPALRAGLELHPTGREVVARTRLADVAVSPEWLLRLAEAPRTALRLDELRRLPLRARVPTVVRWLFPPVAVLRMRDPRAAGGPGAVALAYVRRLGDGLRGLPAAVRGVRRLRVPPAPKADDRR